MTPLGQDGSGSFRGCGNGGDGWVGGWLGRAGAGAGAGLSSVRGQFIPMAWRLGGSDSEWFRAVGPSELLLR